MATIKIDSELMTNYVSTVPVPAGSHHVTVLDQKRMPMVFCLSNDRLSPRLQILRRDAEGHSQLFDIHNLIGLPKDIYVQTFHAEQSWDLRLHLAVAYGDEKQSKSYLHLMKPFSPDVLQASDDPLPHIPGEAQFGTIQKILMAPFSGTNSNVIYPDIFLIHQEPDQTISWGKDIWHIQVQPRFRSWSASKELDTPENVSEILDIAPSSSSYGQGLYVLYVTQGKTKLYARYIRPDPNATDGTQFTFTTPVSCPEGARCIASLLNDKGHSGLLIAAPDGIRYLTVNDATSKDKPGKLIFTDEMFKSLRQLDLCQDKNDVAIWFRNNNDELGYIRTKADKVVEAAVSSLLLSSGQSSSFSAAITAPHSYTGQAVRQMVVSNDRSGNLMLIEQTADIGLWRKTPFHQPSSNKPTPLKSYTITMKARDGRGNSLSSGSVRVSASSSISILLNGRNLLLTTVPTWLDCDQAGSLDFIIPSDSLGSQKLIIDQLRSDQRKILPFTRVEYDASAKPMQLLGQKLEEIKSLDQFKNFKTQSGEDLFEGDVKNDETLMESAHGCLQSLMGAYSSMRPQESSLSAQSDLKIATGSDIVARAQVSSQSFGSAFMDAFYWLRDRFNDVKNWVVKKAGGVWTFVCRIAGEVKKLVLDCVEKICEVATWIWEKVKVGWQKLVDFIGFMFNWGDILATKNTISSTITAGLGYAATKMDHIQTKVDGFFTALENTVDQFGSSIKLDKQLGGKNLSCDQKVSDALSSTSTTWTSERLRNGGASTSTKADFQGSTKSDEATKFWESSMAPEIAKLGAAMSQLGQDITILFKKDGSINGDDIIKVSKSLVKAGIASVRTIVKGLLELVKVFVQKLSELGNAEINIPIFSWLYEKISGGHALTLFDAVSLIIAIPTTIFAKLITGKAPPTFANMDTNLIKGLIEGKDVPDSTKADWTVFCGEVVVGITLTSGAVSLIKLLYKTATQGLDDVLDELDEGPSSLFDVFGIVVDIIGCLMAIPEQSDMPGASYRNAISAISCFRGVYHTFAFFVKGKGSVEKVTLVLDLLTVLANLGLSVAVGVEETKAANSWKDYDKEATETGFITSGLNTLAGVAYFTAFFFKTNPEISAASAAVMVGTVAAGAALEGMVFKLQYDKSRRVALPSPPPF
ncbi:hypothetical protein FocTR4_00004234 [Fusarium oxysporum f. sp. cubense]|uniref:Uncharacterized protein n=1 Tax=Fusarium oxysporum f. sp. cubense TaxID=61366 RepID=A0A5C6TD46_FUSOC|nr:hypothetical protein FocTR4_00004234 [Fusarium oxysporum f. sp. cubense]